MLARLLLLAAVAATLVYTLTDGPAVPIPPEDPVPTGESVPLEVAVRYDEVTLASSTVPRPDPLVLEVVRGGVVHLSGSPDANGRWRAELPFEVAHDQATRVQVASSGWAGRTSLRLRSGMARATVRPRPGRAVTGTVSLASGDPAWLMSVNVFDGPPGPEARVVGRGRTDWEGEFWMLLEPTDRMVIQARDDECGASAWVELPPGHARVELVLRAGRSVTGNLIGPGGGPLSEYQVEAVPAELSEHWDLLTLGRAHLDEGAGGLATARTRTDADGRFELTGLQARDWTLRVATGGGADQVLTIDREIATRSGDVDLGPVAVPLARLDFVFDGLPPEARAAPLSDEYGYLWRDDHDYSVDLRDLDSPGDSGSGHYSATDHWTPGRASVLVPANRRYSVEVGAHDGSHLEIEVRAPSSGEAKRVEVSVVPVEGRRGVRPDLRVEGEASFSIFERTVTVIDRASGRAVAHWSDWDSDEELLVAPGDYRVVAHAYLPKLCGNAPNLPRRFVPTEIDWTVRGPAPTLPPLLVERGGNLTVSAVAPTAVHDIFDCAHIDGDPLRPAGSAILTLRPAAGGPATRLWGTDDGSISINPWYLPAIEPARIFEAFPPGEYVLEADLPGSRADPVPVTIRRGEVARAHLIFEPLD